MKRRLLISLLSLLSIAGCTLEEGIEVGLECPPRMFAYDVDPFGKALENPYLCKLVDDDENIACIPCDFAMNEIVDENYIYLDQDLSGNYIYSNRDENEEVLTRKYLSDDKKDYVINRFSDFKAYAENNESIRLYAITGLCTRTDIEKFDECKVICGNELIDCPDEECNVVISRVDKCAKLKGYENFFSDGICPAKYPICSFGRYDDTGKNFYCTPNVECTQENFNDACQKRIANWGSGVCKNNICIVRACTGNFQPAMDGRTCVSDCTVGQHYDNTAQKCVDDDVDNCGAAGKKCSVTVAQWVNGSCEHGICKVSECSTGFKPTAEQLSCASDCADGQHYDNSAQKCVNDDVNNCGATNKKCSSVVTQWTDGICESGICKVSECSTGFKPAADQSSCTSDCADGQHYDNTAQKCVNDDVDNCGATGKKCAAIVTQWVDGICEHGICKVNQCKTGFKPAADQLSCASDCADGQHYDNTAQKCVDDDVNNCGATGKKCAAIVTQWVDGTCEHGICRVNYCSTGFKPSADQLSCASDCADSQHYDNAAQKCVNDDIDNCGATGKKCAATVTQWMKGNCEHGICKVNQCKTGFKPAIDQLSCASDCADGQHYDNAAQKCVNDDVDNCGATGKKCSATVTQWVGGICEHGICKVNQCKTGFKPAADHLSCASDCVTGQHYDSNAQKCVADDISNCGATGYICANNVDQWKSGSCSSGVCTLSECKSGYKIVNNTCKSDCTTGQHYDSNQAKCVADDISNCGATGYVCANNVDQWKTGSCQAGVCTLSSCKTGYKVVNNTCKSDCTTNQHYDSNQAKCVNDDTSNCGATGYMCSAKVDQWKAGTCTSGVCTLSECKSGYQIVNNTCKPNCAANQHYDSSQAKCVNDDIDNCGATGHKCMDEIKNSKTVSCSNGKCSVSECNSGYSVNNNVCTSSCSNTQYYDSATGTCETSDINNCGQKNFQCYHEISGWSTGNCNYNSCIVTSCSSGYTPASNGKSCVSSCTNSQYYDSTSGTCKASSIDNCGQAGYKCSEKISNWNSGNCINNACIVSTCKSGFTVNNNACVQSCSSSQYYDSSTGSCKASSTDNCGQAGYKCSEKVPNWSSGTCTNNVCTVSACKSGYKVNNNVCVADCSDFQYYDSATGTCKSSDINNCGKKYFACYQEISGWVNGTCNYNSCIVTSCTTGYAPATNGKSCVASCTNTQYYDSSTGSCQTSNVTNCGQKGYNCSEHHPNSDSGTCTNNKCIVTACFSGYNLINNECRPACTSSQYYDSSTSTCQNSNTSNCGQKGYKCSDLAGWITGTCTNNKCVATYCSAYDGYHLSDGKCVADTITCCGDSCVDCKSSKKACMYGTCLSI